MCTNFGAQLRADFSRHYNVDLAQLVATNRYQAVVDYYDMLPTYSLTREAILNDPETVKEMADQGLFGGGGGGKKTVAISENTPVLDALYDILLEMRISNYIGRQGKGKIEPPPTVDRTVIDEAVKQSDLDAYENLKKRFSG